MNLSHLVPFAHLHIHDVLAVIIIALLIGAVRLIKNRPRKVPAARRAALREYAHVFFKKGNK